MSPTTLIFLYVLGGLSLFFLLYIAIKVGRNFYRVKDKKPIKEEIVEPEVVSTEETALSTEVIEPITETTKNLFVARDILKIDCFSLLQLNACKFCKNTISVITKLLATVMS